jgi:ABC-type glycerol-3-phosphate transport system substrate-binding protein
MRTALAGALLAVCAAPALAGTVTVITSFPKDLTQAYKAAFEKANPGITLEILNKNTVSGIAYVRETRSTTALGFLLVTPHFLQKNGRFVGFC